MSEKARHQGGGFPVIKPVFLISLPRSGSTLLQKLLMTQRGVDSRAETWMILASLAPFSENVESYSNYSVSTMRSAHESFFVRTSARKKHLKALGVAMLDTLSQGKSGSVLLEKTPRNYLVLDEIAEAFPDGRFIVLLRDPVDILSSVMHTWSRGGFFRVPGYQVDFELGSKSISEFVNGEHQNRCIVCNYENLIDNVELEVSRLAKFIGIEFSEKSLSDFNDFLSFEALGDPIQVNRSRPVMRTERDNVAAKTLFGRIFIKYFLRQVDDGYFRLCGTSKDISIAKLSEIQRSGVGLRYLFQFFFGKAAVMGLLPVFIRRARARSTQYLS